MHFLVKMAGKVRLIRGLLKVELQSYQYSSITNGLKVELREDLSKIVLFIFMLLTSESMWAHKPSFQEAYIYLSLNGIWHFINNIPWAKEMPQWLSFYIICRGAKLSSQDPHQVVHNYLESCFRWFGFSGLCGLLDTIYSCTHHKLKNLHAWVHYIYVL